MTNIQGAGSILEQMRALKLESSGLEIRNDTNKVAQADFGQFLQNALDGVNSRIVESDNLKERFELGDESISLRSEINALMLTRQLCRCRFKL